MTPDLVLAAVGQLRVSWDWLKTALEPGRSRRNQRFLTETAIAARSRRAVEERTDRSKLLNAGKLLSTNQHAPANVAAIDARHDIAAEVDDIACEMTLRVTPVRNVRGYRPDPTNADTRFRGAIDWVSANVKHIYDQPILNSGHARLIDCDRLAATVTGNSHQRRPMAAECPACGLRTLSWSEPAEVEQEAAVQCGNPKCRCTGDACPCRLPLRTAGMAHLWIQARWADLARHINQEA